MQGNAGEELLVYKVVMNALVAGVLPQAVRAHREGHHGGEVLDDPRQVAKQAADGGERKPFVHRLAAKLGLSMREPCRAR